MCLGWENSWNRNDRDETPQAVKDCQSKKHVVMTRNLDQSGRGYDKLFWCDICGYEYHVDSSD